MWCVDNIGSAELDLWKQYTWPALEGFFLHRDFQSSHLPPSNLTPRVSLCQDLFPPPLDCTAGFVPLGQLDLFSSDEGFVTEGNYFLVIRVNVPSGKTSVMTNSSSNIHSFRSFRCAPIHLIWKITYPSYLSVGQTPAPLRLETNETAVRQPESTSATWVSGSTPALPQVKLVMYILCNYSQL